MLREYIPGTAARADRLLHKGVAGKDKGDILVELEYPDGKVSLVPAEWNDEYMAWVTVRGRLVYPRGEGRKVITLGNTDLVRAYAPNAGAISTEAALVATAQETEEFTPIGPDGEPLPDDPADLDPERADQVMTDGGDLAVADRRTDFPLYHAVQFDLSDADRYDPNPVQANEVSTAIDIAEAAGDDGSENLRYGLYGLLAGAGIALVAFALFMFLGGGGGGGGGGTGVNSLLWLLPALRPAIGGGADG
jgi:hypothetical protein